MDGQGPTSVSFDPGYHGPLMHTHPRMLHPRCQRILYILIKGPQDLLSTYEQMGLAPEGIQHPGELDGDIPRTDDGDPLRLLLQREEPIGVDPFRGARNNFVARDGRPSTGGDTYIISTGEVSTLSVRAGYLYRIGRDKLGETRVILHVLAREVVFVDGVELADVGVPLGFESGPIEFGRGDAREVVACSRVAEFFREVCGMPRYLLESVIYLY